MRIHPHSRSAESDRRLRLAVDMRLIPQPISVRCLSAPFPPHLVSQAMLLRLWRNSHSYSIINKDNVNVCRY